MLSCNRSPIPYRSVKNLLKVDDAIGTLYKVWLGVAAALMVKFARTISLSLALADGVSFCELNV